MIDHTTATWTPEEFEPPPNADFGAPTNPHTITELELQSVYAVQLIYRDARNNSHDVDVFAARNAYVWPSFVAAANGQRVASFPLKQRLTDRTPDGHPRLLYRICEETFGPPTDPRTTDWVTLIDGAMSHWQSATGGLIRTQRDRYTSQEVVGSPELAGVNIGDPKPCADYAGLVDDIGRRISSFMPTTPSDTILKLVLDFLHELRTSGILLKEHLYKLDEHTRRDFEGNEIIMYRDDSAALETVRRVGAFNQFANDVGFEYSCWYEEIADGYYVFRDNVPMCTSSAQLGDKVTSDIFIRSSQYEGGISGMADPLAVPETGARFNRCFVRDDTDSTSYRDFLHEVGHVLGISGSGSGHPGSDPAAFVDSVMDYNFTQPGCEPYPLDLMAIYALYQTVVP